jgi:hypothetical protein
MGMRSIDQRIYIVVRKTRFDDIHVQYATRGYAGFAMAKARVSAHLEKVKDASTMDLAMIEGRAFDELKSIEQEDVAYKDITQTLRRELDFEIPVQVVDRAHVPNITFGKRDVIVVLGQDGLVANVAKYAIGLPIVGVNPDRNKFDGILLPFEWKQTRSAVQRTLEGRARIRESTLAEVRLGTGHRLLAFNDFFVGARSHVSARYRLEVGTQAENQSSSGLIISTGAGSTGWLSSVLNMASGIMRLGQTQVQRPAVNLRWEDKRLVYVVREPFVSKRSGANVVAGMIEAEERITVESMMGNEGTIFSDGVEADSLPFREGTIATIGVADERARLVVG